MSRNFFATHIYILDADAVAPGHDGLPFPNIDYPKGTLMCKDADGFVYTTSSNRPSFDEETDRDPKTWPNCTEEGVPLWRNYWKYVYDSNEPKFAPYYNAIRSAPITTIVNCLA